MSAKLVRSGLHILVVGWLLLALSACSGSAYVGKRSDSSRQERLYVNNDPGVTASAQNIERKSPISDTASSNSDSNTSLKPASADVKEPLIEIDFVGDVMMDSYIGNYIHEQGVDYPWTDVSPILQSADLAAANLETSVSKRGITKKPKGFGFRSAPYTLKGLQDSGIDYVSLANNHILDFGTKALSDTLKNLDHYGIHHAGAGRTIEEAEKLAIIERKGLKIGFLSYSEIIPWTTWIADTNSPGVAPMKPDDTDRLLANIEKADKLCDILIVMPHWGVEYTDYPLEWETNLAHQMIDRGADAIIGAHPHVLQGIEVYDHKPIIYSTGNFVFLKKDDNAGHTAIFKLKFNRKEFVEGSVQPVNIQYGKANLLQPGDAVRQDIIDRLVKLSGKLGTVMDDTGMFQSSSVPSPVSSPEGKSFKEAS